MYWKGRQALVQIGKNTNIAKHIKNRSKKKGQDQKRKRTCSANHRIVKRSQPVKGKGEWGKGVSSINVSKNHYGGNQTQKSTTTSTRKSKGKRRADH